MAEHDFSVVVDPAGNRLTSMKHVGAEATGERPPTNIDRRTFRQILLAGLDDVVHHGTEVAGFSDEGESRGFAAGRRAVPWKATRSWRQMESGRRSGGS